MEKKSYDAYTSDGRELREQGTPGFPAAVYEGNLQLEEVPMHWHAEFEAGSVVRGSIELQVGSRTFLLREGDGYFINSGAVHAFRACGTEDSLNRSVVFEASLVGGRMDSLFFLKYCQPLLLHNELECVILHREIAWQADAVAAIRTAWDCASGALEEYELDFRYRLSHLLALLWLHLSLRNDTLSEKSRRDAARIKGMLQYLHENYSRELTVGEIAQAADISHSECLRCFHDTIGTTPLKYLKNYRLQKACEALKSTDSSVSDISAACGFTDVSYFTKVFRTEKGCTPGEYRRREAPAAGERTQ